MLSLILAIAITGVLVWLILQLPMPSIFKNAILALVLIVLLVYVVRFLSASFPTLNHF